MVPILVLCWALSLSWGLQLLHRGAFFAAHGPSSLCVDFINYLGCQNPTTAYPQRCREREVGGVIEKSWGIKTDNERLSNSHQSGKWRCCMNLLQNTTNSKRLDLWRKWLKQMQHWGNQTEQWFISALWPKPWKIFNALIVKMQVFHFSLLFSLLFVETQNTVCVFLSWSRWVEEAGLSSVVCTLRRLGLSVLQPVSSQACRLHTCGPHRSVMLALTPLMLYPSTTHLSSTPRRSSAPLPQHFPPSVNILISVTFSTTVVPLYYLDYVELWNYYYYMYLFFLH